MKKIKIFFEDFWPGFDISNNFITELLRKEYEVVIDKNPDYLFFSIFTYNHLHYENCIKIFYSGENTTPDFNLCDYAMCFHHLHFGDRYMRYPLYVDSGYEHLGNKSFDEEKMLKRKFCNFVYGNSNADPTRERFFHLLSKYKKIDSAGLYLNNIGRVVNSYDKKLSFIQDYKFTLAFENSSVSGYTTEKIVHPMLVNSMPVYWGNPDIHLDFNKDSFVYASDFRTLEDLVEEVIRLDRDDNAYIEKLSKPWYAGDDYAAWRSKVLIFLRHIFEQDITDAKRTTIYGHMRSYLRTKKTLELLNNKTLRRISLFNRDFALIGGKVKK